jgi:hypothetical protein
VGSHPQTPFLKLLSGFSRNGTALSSEDDKDSLIVVPAMSTIPGKTKIKSLERGSGKNLSSERFAPITTVFTSV